MADHHRFIVSLGSAVTFEVAAPSLPQFDYARLAEELAPRLRHNVDNRELAAELAPHLRDLLDGARNQRRLLSPKEAAEVLGLSERTVRGLVGGQKPRIPSFKVEGSRKIEPAAIDAFIAERRCES